ncbi:hypothetical protein AB0I35_30725 [Nocardia sp. NPDC050378]|uniref:hypothetical protein n=1 Tax=Nocardia sp. NPDC050378 TaxID=3155400 RepID=UPI0033EE04F7
MSQPVTRQSPKVLGKHGVATTTVCSVGKFLPGSGGWDTADALTAGAQPVEFPKMEDLRKETKRRLAIVDKLLLLLTRRMYEKITPSQFPRSIAEASRFDSWGNLFAEPYELEPDKKYNVVSFQHDQYARLRQVLTGDGYEKDVSYFKTPHDSLRSLLGVKPYSVSDMLKLSDSMQASVRKGAPIPEMTRIVTVLNLTTADKWGRFKTYLGVAEQEYTPFVSQRRVKDPKKAMVETRIQTFPLKEEYLKVGDKHYVLLQTNLNRDLEYQLEGSPFYQSHIF